MTTYKRFYNDGGMLNTSPEFEHIFNVKLNDLLNYYLGVGYSHQDFKQAVDFYSDLIIFDKQINKELK